MAGEELLINAFLDAIGASSAAQEHKRKNAESMYNTGYAGLQAGIPLKEQGIDPKFIESSLGPDYRAHLEGFEKSDAFKNANQQLMAKMQGADQLNQIGQAAMAYLGEPVDAGPYARADSGGPSFEGGRAPRYEEYQQRLSTLSPEVKTLLYGPQVEAAGRGERELQQVAIPEAQATTTNAQSGATNAQTGSRQATVAEGNLDINRGEFALNRATLVRNQRQDRNALIDSASKLIGSMYPTLTMPQLRAAAKYQAGVGTEKSLRNMTLPDGTSLSDLPGIVRGTGKGQTGVPPATLFNRVATVVDSIPKFVTDPKNQKLIRRWTTAEREGFNNTKLVELSRALADYHNEYGQQDVGKLVAEIESRARVLSDDGRLIPLHLLPEEQRIAKLNLIAQTLQGTDNAVGGAADKWLTDNGFGAAGGASAPAAPAVPAAQPVIQSPAQPSGSIVPRTQSVPGVVYPVAPSSAPSSIGGIPAGFGSPVGAVGNGGRPLSKPIRYGPR